MNKFDIDNIYKNTPPDQIPWNIETPPKPLVELLETGQIKPCKTLDLGCGLGNYALYLAEKGFDVVAVDLSPTAIKMAQQTAKKKNLSCTFIAADVLDDLSQIKDTFDFVYDWGLLHHILPPDRKKYIENVCSKLNTKGHYLSVCFSEKDTSFEGSGKYRKTSIGSTLYFSSEAELRALFSPHLNIHELKTIPIFGRNISHLAVYAFMTKK